MFVLRPPLSFIYERATGNLGRIKLDDIKKIGKGMFELIQKDTYSCMIHMLLMNINLQVFYQELSFIHVLMLNVTLLCLTWID